MIEAIQTEQFDSLLDVGCMYGYLLQEARRVGIRRVKGIELSEEPIARARQVAIEIFQGTIEDYAATKPDGFDVIFAQHVLEHVPDYDSFLKTVFSLLRPGGQFVICVPHFGSRTQRCFKRSWGWYQLPAHVFHYSTAAVDIICRRHGFEKVQIKFCGGDSLFILLTILYFLKNGGARFSSRITRLQEKVISMASLVLRRYYHFGDEEIVAIMRRPKIHDHRTSDPELQDKASHRA